jgi:hypothetical protein
MQNFAMDSIGIPWRPSRPLGARDGIPPMPIVHAALGLDDQLRNWFRRRLVGEPVPTAMIRIITLSGARCYNLQQVGIAHTEDFTPSTIEVLRRYTDFVAQAPLNLMALNVSLGCSDVLREAAQALLDNPVHQFLTVLTVPGLVQGGERTDLLTQLRLPSLRRLTLTGCISQITGCVVLDLPDAPELEELHGFVSPGVLPDVVDLRRYPKLRRLSGVNGDSFVGVQLPPSITSLSHDALARCETLASLEVAPAGEASGLRNVGDGVLASCPNLPAVDLAECPGLQRVGHRFFSMPLDNQRARGRTALLAAQTVVLPRAPRRPIHIGDSFLQHSNVASVLHMEHVGSFGNHCLDCTQLSVIDLQRAAHLTDIGSHFAADCPVLTALLLPDSLRTVGSHLASGCPRLMHFDLGTGVRDVGRGAFGGTPVTQVDLSRATNLQRVWHIGCGREADAAERRWAAQLTHLRLPPGLRHVDSGFLQGMDGQLPRAVFDLEGCYQLETVGDRCFTFGAPPPFSFGAPPPPPDDDEETVGDRCFTFGAPPPLSFGAPPPPPDDDDDDDDDTIAAVMREQHERQQHERYRAMRAATMQRAPAAAAVPEVAAPAHHCDPAVEYGPSEALDLTRCTAMRHIGAEFCKGHPLVAELALPASLAVIGDAFLARAPSLSRLVIAAPSALASVGDYFIRGTGVASVDLADCHELTSIGECFANGCVWLCAVAFPPSLLRLGPTALYNCAKIVELDLSQCRGMTAVAHSFASDCRSLRHVALPPTIDTIGDDFLNRATSLTTVTGLGASLRVIGDGFLNYCSALRQLDMRACCGVVTIGADFAAKMNGLRELALPPSLESAGDGFVNDCSQLVAVTVDACRLRRLPRDAFYRCRSLSSVDLRGCAQLSGNDYDEGCGVKVLLPPHYPKPEDSYDVDIAVHSAVPAYKKQARKTKSTE